MFEDRFDLERLKEPKLEKGRERRRISERVFDDVTLMTLYELAKKKHIGRIRSVVSTGKEANVYNGVVDDGEIAIKIYCVETSDFKSMSRYIRGDPRFRSWKDRRQLVYLWAKKEHSNLIRVYKKLRCPEPIAALNNVLVMGFIGKNGIPSPRLKDVGPKNPEKCFDTLVRYMREMYRAGLVHGDLSEYNILYDSEPILIDFSMGVLLQHPLAHELLERDIKNILRYFRSFGIEKEVTEVIDFVRS